MPNHCSVFLNSFYGTISSGKNCVSQLANSLRMPDVHTNIHPTFSGHEMFVLGSIWLKKGYDMIWQYSDLFVQPKEVSQEKVLLLRGRPDHRLCWNISS